MSAPVVSVALCTYDGARYLDEQLRSIAQQTRTVDEIVIADDGSTDGTLDIVAAHRALLPGLRLLAPEPHLGVTANFERAVVSTRGDLIMLSDQDDVWHPDRVERSVAALHDPGVLLVHADADLIGAGSEGETLLGRLAVSTAVRRDLAAGRAFSHLMRRNLVTGATVALRRDLLATALPFPGGWLHDEWLAILAAVWDGSRLIDAPLIDYRQHATNEVGMVRRDARHNLSRLSQDRAERNARLLARAEQLERRAATMTGIPAERRRSIVEKVRHERVRSALPSGRAARLGPVLRELATGRYRRFGNGARDVLRDVVQPAG